jgi:hypothetical protein
MKMLIISDTHSNYMALLAVAHTEQADQVLIIDEVGYLGLDHAVLGIAKVALIILATSEATDPRIGLEMRGQLLKLRDADLPFKRKAHSRLRHPRSENRVTVDS